jgi:hypothetical protein
MVPVIDGWIAQWNPVVSETSTVAVPVSPAPSARSALPSSSVNVCGAVSLFVTVTSVGPDTVIVDGLKAKPSIVISVPPPPPPPSVSPVAPVEPVAVGPVVSPPSSSPPQAARTKSDGPA